jgi:membrane protease YdiL (CAAX protease family)
MTPRRVFPVFLALFMLVWALRATVLYELDRALPPGSPRLWTGLLVKTLLWAGAAVGYVRWVRHESPLRTLRVSTPPRRRSLRGATLVILLYLAGVTWDVCRIHGVSVGALWVKALDGGPTVLAWTAGSAFVEEVFFRGLVLGELSERSRFWVANATSALLFVLVHWPYWLWNRGLDAAVLRDSVGVFIMGLVLGYLVKKTGSIWPGTFLHTLSNCVSGAL